jgi:hypothetical protein
MSAAASARVKAGPLGNEPMSRVDVSIRRRGFSSAGLGLSLLRDLPQFVVVLAGDVDLESRYLECLVAVGARRGVHDRSIYPSVDNVKLYSLVLSTTSQALVEYALIVALVAVLAAATMFLLGTQVSQVLSIVGNALT